MFRVVYGTAHLFRNEVCTANATPVGRRGSSAPFGARDYGHVVIEDLNIKSMLRNRKLARTIVDVELHELRRQLAYKAEVEKTVVTVADRCFPSTKTCSDCGA